MAYAGRHQKLKDRKGGLGTPTFPLVSLTNGPGYVSAFLLEITRVLVTHPLDGSVWKRFVLPNRQVSGYGGSNQSQRF